MLKSFLPASILFILIFGWKITELIDLITLVSVVLVCRAFVCNRTVSSRMSLYALAVLAVLSIYSLGVVLLNGLLDVQIALRSLRAFLNFAGAAALVGVYHEHYGRNFFRNIVRDLHLSISLHAVIMLVMYSHDGIRNFVYQLTDAFHYGSLSSPFRDGLRISGLTYGLSQTSVLQLSGLLLVPVVYANCRATLTRLLVLGTVPLLVLSMIICGRSGLFIGLLYLPFITVGFIFSAGSEMGPTAKLGRLLQGTLLVVAVIAAFIFVQQQMPEKFFSVSLGHASEVFAALQLSGPTIDAVSRMYFLPATWLETFFGSSNMGRGALDYIPSDVGWVKNIFSIGIIGTLLTFLPNLMAMLTAWNARHWSRRAALFCFLIFLSAPILNFKEMALLTRNQWSVHAVLFAALALQLCRQNGKEAENNDRA